MKELTGEELLSLRLNLRTHLRRLIKKISIKVMKEATILIDSTPITTPQKTIISIEFQSGQIRGIFVDKQGFINIRDRNILSKAL
jgi:hypothetical protein